MPVGDGLEWGSECQSGYHAYAEHAVKRHAVACGWRKCGRRGGAMAGQPGPGPGHAPGVCRSTWSAHGVLRSRHPDSVILPAKRHLSMRDTVRCIFHYNLTSRPRRLIDISEASRIFTTLSPLVASVSGRRPVCTQSTNSAATNRRASVCSNFGAHISPRR